MKSDPGREASSGSLETLWNGFVSPPDSARPRVWWHWMDGNVDLDGIRRDLAWMHGVGVRGVQVFDGGLGLPSIVEEPVIPGTDRWRDALQVASKIALDLGIEFTVATSAGWSASGGPWVKPEDAMRKIVWSQAILASGTDEFPLPALPDSVGGFQDSPPWGTASSRGYSQDICVLAIPYDERHDPHQPASIRASAEFTGTASLIDQSFTEGIQLPRDPDARSSVWLEQEFRSAVTVRSCELGIPGPHGFGAAPPVSAVLEASADGIDYWTVAEFPSTRVPARTISFSPVTATHFRLVLEADGLAAAIPPIDAGVVYPPVFRAVTAFHVTQFALYEASMVSHREVKAGFAAAAFYDQLDADASATAGTVGLDSVIDVTQYVRGNTLQWSPPEGAWRILRFGSTLTGQTNGPAVAEATGLEVDKLDGRRVREYIDHHLQQYGDIALGGLLSDSIEAGPQNDTDQMPRKFMERRGYDMLPWFVTIAGLLVEDAASTDLFLSDFRLTISELLAEEYYGTLAEVAHENGAIYYAEALEDHRPQLGDDLAMRSHADVPMGAMWTFSPESGPSPTYVADLKGASSVAHVYDRS
ncbi:MAG: glycosyl hydrolase, partial [Mycetocola sp.]